MDKNKKLMIILFVAMIFNSFTPIAIKLGLNELPTMFFLGVRFLIAALAMSFFFRLKKENLKKNFFSGAISLVTISLFFYSFKIFSPGIVNLISEVPFSIFLATFIFNEKMSRREATGVLGAFAGLFLVTSNVSLDNSHLLYIPLLASFMAGINVNIIKKVKLEVGELLLGRFLTIGIGASIISYFFETGQVEAVRNISDIAIFSFLWVLLYGTLIAKFVVSKAIVELPIHVVIPATMMLPPLVLIWDYFIFGNLFTFQQMLGVVIVLGGIFMAEHKSKKKEHHHHHKWLHRHH
ncbi:MAG: DMT family transporter [Alphaproteobacteria bacterium]|jgi:O-acetylserine/cysteine efflux transporter|nr:DMT family transporter [Alphaproteobacteria bacterium]